MKAVLFLLLTYIILSCEKVDLSGPNNYLIGDYEWVYTEISNTEFLGASESVDKFGIRINAKSKMLFFTNGLETNKKTISRIGEDSGNSIMYIKKSRNSWSIMQFNGDTLTSYYYPHSGRKNYFIKK